MRLGLLSGQVFPSGEVWLAAVTGAALLSAMYAATEAILRDTMAAGSVGQSELGASALLKAIWRDMRLAILLTHLLKLSVTFLVCL